VDQETHPHEFKVGCRYSLFDFLPLKPVIGNRDFVVRISDKLVAGLNHEHIFDGIDFGLFPFRFVFGRQNFCLLDAWAMPILHEYEVRLIFFEDRRTIVSCS